MASGVMWGLRGVVGCEDGLDSVEMQVAVD